MNQKKFNLKAYKTTHVLVLTKTHIVHDYHNHWSSPENRFRGFIFYAIDDLRFNVYVMEKN